MSVFIIGEIGINHNGDLELAKKMIKKAKEIGCDAVKFQKRTIDLVYSKEYLSSYRESPWGKTQREQKEGLEFNYEEYCSIDEFCKEIGIEWFASAWDLESQYFLQGFNLKYNKIASAMLGNIPFLELVASQKKYTFISTGMSTWQELDQVVQIFKNAECPFELMHCNSTYPMKEVDANLLLMEELRKRYNCKVGYSGHEEGILVSLVAAAKGATSIERHITIDKTMYGSDQKASIEFSEMAELIRTIRRVENILGDGIRSLSPDELIIRKKLRGN